MWLSVFPPLSHRKLELPLLTACSVHTSARQLLVPVRERSPFSGKREEATVAVAIALAMAASAAALARRV